MKLLSAKWLNKFHINIIVVFPENIHTPSTEGNGNLIVCVCVCVCVWVGGRSSKGNNFRGVEWIQVFQGATAATDSYFTVSRCFKTIILQYCGWAFWTEIF